MSINDLMCLHLTTFDVFKMGFPGGTSGKELLPIQETQVQSLGREDPLEEDMATHSSILAWEIPWTEEAGRYSPWGHKDSDTTESLNTHTHTRTHTGLSLI